MTVQDSAPEAAAVLGFAQSHDRPIAYMQRIRDYYLALGFDNPYRWAQFTDVPFTRLKKPLSESRVVLITTAAPYQPGKGDQGPGAPYNAAAKFYKVYSADVDDVPQLGISHVGYDRNHTTATDVNSYFPLAALQAAAAAGTIGSVAPRFHGAPTNRSQVTTIEADCADLLQRAQEDEADAAIIVAN